MLFAHIVSDPKVCHGKPCFKGTRILVSTILDSLAAGDSLDLLVREYPPLKRENILEAIEYASVLTKGEEHYLRRKAV